MSINEVSSIRRLTLTPAPGTGDALCAWRLQPATSIGRQVDLTK
jgi:hypothetical protein